ncbi:MAG: FmdB family zinc ribbon protein [Candidatus Methylacidiphilales bacterium]
MPLYQYELCEGDCKICGGKFELMRPVSRPALQACPVCKKPVRKCFGGFHAPHLTRPVGPAEAREQGFKVYKKVGRGEYELQ